MAKPVIVLLASTLIAVVFTALLSPSSATDNACYVCHMKPGSNHCMDARQLLITRNKYEHTLIDNGTQADALATAGDDISACPSTMPYCVIETIMKEGQYIVFYRDCSDGTNFATDVSESRLKQVPDDNSTHCGLVTKPESAMMCISLCSDPLCNGPTFDTSGTAGYPQLFVQSSVLGVFVMHVVVALCKSCVV